MRGWYPAGVELFAEAIDALDEQSEDEGTAIARVNALAFRHGFSATLGRLEVDVDDVATAIDSVRDFVDPESHLFMLVPQAVGLLYLGRRQELAAVMDEVIALGEGPASRDWSEGPFWAAGTKNVRAFIALTGGDVDLAVRLLEESRALLEPLDELFFMTWNLGHRARVAIMEERIEDAIELFSRSAGRARQLGFQRGLQVSLAALGDANLAIGDLVAAEAALIESLDAAERTSMVPEMLGTLTKVASVFASTGRQRQAVELLATVLAEPASDRQLFTESAPINAAASAALEELEQEMDPGDYEQAVAAGSSRSYAIAIKELIDTIA